MTDDGASEELDARGVLCPQPIIDLAAAMRKLPVGGRVRVLCDDSAFPEDLRNWCRACRQELQSMHRQGRVHVAVVRKIHAGP